MELIKILMDFDNIKKFEKSAEFTYNSKRFNVSVGVNPLNNNVLFSLFLDREKVIENRVCLVGEGMFSSFGDYEFSNIINGDFMFIPSSKTYQTGNSVKIEDLGNKVDLYFVSYGDSYEN